MTSSSGSIRATADPIPQAAIALAGRGWRVFPVAPRGKTPLVDGGFRSATSDLEAVAAWWRRWPDANIGLATGGSSTPWVLDLDGPEGDATARRWTLEHGAWGRSTLAARTGRGWHLYFAPAAHLTCRVRVAPGVDVRAAGGYVVAPPSVHPSGARYAWRDASCEPAPAPAWLLELVAAPSARPAPAIEPRPQPDRTAAPRAAGGPEAPIRSPLAYLDSVLRRAVGEVVAAGEGRRNDQLYRQAVWAFEACQRAGVDRGRAWGELVTAARLAGLDDLEATRTIASALERAQGGRL